jgi:tRNA threonylcarbamoyladenosine biosynthesis protein TsaB
MQAVSGGQDLCRNHENFFDEKNTGENVILAINTSSFQFSLALLDKDGTLRAEHVMAGGAGRFAGMFPALENLLSALESSIGDVSALAVAIGPGSFTGLRVGLAAAKGFAHALKAPLVGISSLEALACQLAGASAVIAPILDARRGEVFTAPFTPGLSYPERLADDTCLSFDELPSFYTSPVIYIGNDYPRQMPLIRNRLRDSATLAPPHLWNLRASAVGSLGLRRLHAGDYDDPEALAPLYLRAPDIRSSPSAAIFRKFDRADASSPVHS